MSKFSLAVLTFTFTIVGFIIGRHIPETNAAMPTLLLVGVLVALAVGNS